MCLLTSPLLTSTHFTNLGRSTKKKANKAPTKKSLLTYARIHCLQNDNDVAMPRCYARGHLHPHASSSFYLGISLSPSLSYPVLPLALALALPSLCINREREARA
jgi:hypothetical protein